MPKQTTEALQARKQALFEDRKKRAAIARKEDAALRKRVDEHSMLKPRRCKYCRATFCPKRTQDKDSRFCEPNHRKAYWRYGGLPFDKIMDRCRKEIAAAVAEAVKALSDRVAALEAVRDSRKR